MTRASDDSLLDRFPSFQMTISLSLAFLSEKSVLGLKAKLHNTHFQYLCVLLHDDLTCNLYPKQTDLQLRLGRCEWLKRADGCQMPI